MTQINGWMTPRCHHSPRKSILKKVTHLAKPALQTDPQVDEAMNMVLEKEQQSREKIEQCEREAATLLDKAQRRARAVSERTDKRITAFRQRCEDATQRTVKALLAEHKERSQGTPIDKDEISRIEVAVRRLASKLTGNAGEESDRPVPP
jgi:hypothetical protein